MGLVGGVIYLYLYFDKDKCSIMEVSFVITYSYTQGNQLFKEGKYEAAVERYTRAIELNPTSQILPANRAMALIKLQRYVFVCTFVVMVMSLSR